MANWYVSSVAWASVAQWTATHTYAVGNYVRQLATPSYGNERVFKATSITTGISGGSEPAWNLGNNATTTDSGVTWTQVGGQEANQLAGNWTAPLGTLQAALNLAVVTNDNTFLSSDHTETNAGSFSLAVSGVSTLLASVSRTGASLPPTDTDYLAGATINTTGANSITIGGICKVIGLTFKAGSSSNAASINLAGAYGGASDLSITLLNCALILNNTNTTSQITTQLPTFGTSAAVFLRNTTMQFGATAQGLSLGDRCYFEWADTPSALSGSVPNPFIQGNTIGRQLIHGVDLSTLTGNIIASAAVVRGQMDIFNCSLNSSVTLIPTNITHSSPAAWVRFDNCDNSSSGLSYNFKFADYGWTISPTSVIARVGGASDGTTSYGHTYLSAYDTSSLILPATGRWMYERLTSVGSSVTLTINLISFTSSIPNSSNLWLEMEDLESSTVPLATGHTTSVTLPTTTGTNLSATTDDWTAGTVAARQNSHSYSVGDFIKVASNTGRVFMCTTAGTSASSEPGGYASAVDGGSVTDSGAVFRAGWRCKLTQSFTPQMKGYINARVNGARSSGDTLVIDPKLNVA